MTIKRTKLEEYMAFVKKKYPDFVIDYWFEHGELLFWKRPEDVNTREPSSCYKKNGKLVIEDEF